MRLFFIRQDHVSVIGLSRQDARDAGAADTLFAGALLERGCKVRAMVRPTSNRTKLENLGVTDFVVADLNDPSSLKKVMMAEPRAEALVASAAGFTVHTHRTKGDNSKTDTQGYRNLVDAAKNASIPRLILISIIECDKAPGVPHFRQKFMAEQYLAERGQPYLALRAGAFLDRARDVVAAKIPKGVFPDIIPGVPMSMVYSIDLARYAAQAALDVSASALNQSVDVCCEVPATGSMVAAAFARVLGRRVVAKPVFPPLVLAVTPLLAAFIPSLRDGIAVLAWIGKGGYVSHDTQKQKILFGEPPTIQDVVARYCRDKGLAGSANKAGSDGFDD